MVPTVLSDGRDHCRFVAEGLAACQKGRTFAPMETPVLSISSLSTGYGRGRRRHEVGRGLTASLPPATLTVLAGTNGAGKSTLLRTLAGFVKPLAGTVAWLGRPIGSYRPAGLARTLAVVLTDRPDTGALTVREVVSLGRYPYTPPGGRLSPADRAVVVQAMEAAGVSPLASRPCVSLSDGERQRVMIAKALAQQTPVVLLDEPTAYLDLPGKAAVMRLLVSLVRTHGKTVLLSTHDLDLALPLADRLWLLAPDGITEGTPAGLAGSGAVERFFSSADIGFLPADMRFRLKEPPVPTTISPDLS